MSSASFKIITSKSIDALNKLEADMYLQYVPVGLMH